MAEMTIRLRCDPVTGKKDIVVSLRSDEDALPHEHEHMHRQLVEKLIERGLVEEEEVGKIVVEREETADIPDAPLSNPGNTERQAEEQGN